MTHAASVSGLTGKVAIVTGASSSIGLATATVLANRGAAAAVNYRRRRDEAEAPVRTLEAAGGRARAFECDVTQSDSVSKMIADVTASLGPVDILVNNGIHAGGSYEGSYEGSRVTEFRGGDE
jgi:3-oxoacyl-[acyl-carrier protein] reductase